ncbi:MAG: glycosyltransferase family 2 protein [Verrucomicrobiota bacterium]
MLLSVVISTRNRVNLLRRTLEGVARVTCPSDRYEVIVVDTASTDDTGAMGRELGPRLFRHFRYEWCDRPGLHIGRNRGAAVARGEIVVLADDDIRPFPTWLSGMAKAFVAPEVGLAGGNDLPDFEATPPAGLEALWSQHPQGRVHGALSLVDFGDRVKEIPPQYVFGCNFGIRKQLWRKAGGFHPDGLPEELLRYRGDGETAIAKAVVGLGYRSLFHPEASVYHWVPRGRMSYGYLWRRGFMQGISDSYTAIREAAGLAAPKPLEWLRRIKRRAWRLGRWARETLAEEASAAYARHAYRQGHVKGYDYHQREVRNDASLLEWVLRPDYLDENATPWPPH